MGHKSNFAVNLPLVLVFLQTPMFIGTQPLCGYFYQLTEFGNTQVSVPKIRALMEKIGSINPYVSFQQHSGILHPQ